VSGGELRNDLRRTITIEIDSTDACIKSTHARECRRRKHLAGAIQHADGAPRKFRIDSNEKGVAVTIQVDGGKTRESRAIAVVKEDGNALSTTRLSEGSAWTHVARMNANATAALRVFMLERSERNALLSQPLRGLRCGHDHHDYLAARLARDTHRNVILRLQRHWDGDYGVLLLEL